MVGGPLLVIAALIVGVAKFATWAKPHADNYMADIRANSQATRELVKTLEHTQANMSYQLSQICQSQEMLARSDQRTSRAINRMVGVLESRPCIGLDGMKPIADSDDFADKEDSTSDA